jgi:glucose/arabinose dehydrogenase
MYQTSSPSDLSLSAAHLVDQLAHQPSAPGLDLTQKNARQLVFVDAAVQDFSAAAAQISANAIVYYLDGQRDGVIQMGEILAQHNNVAGVHIISYGRPGEIHLGNTVLSEQTIATYSSQIQNWKSALTEDADLYLYGCNVAAGGRSLLDQLDSLTGAEVAASDDFTGNPALGGDWQLEVQTGEVAAVPWQDEAIAYSELLDQGTGLRGEYFNNRDFTAPVLTRTDATVNFDWGSGSPDSRMAPNTFSVRWTGQVQPRYSETYTFYTTSDDGVRLYINNQLVINRFVDQSAREASGQITLQAGQKYDIRLEYYENGGNAVSKLLWSSASQGKEIIPQSRLYEPVVTQQAGTGNGLRGEYYNNIDFTDSVLVRTDEAVNFNWNGGSPDARIGNDTFSVRWTGEVQPLYSEEYTFYSTTDDGVRLYINDQLVINNFVDQAATERSGRITLQAGQRYSIRMEYYENGGGASANLGWSSASQVKQLLPKAQLYSPAVNTGANGTGDGLRAEYFDNIDFTNTVLNRVDASVDFDWGRGSPTAAIANDTFSVRWSGQVEPRFSEEYTFYTTTDDGVRLFINDQLVVDGFVDQAATERSGRITLQAGQKYNIRMEYYENGGDASAKLRWSSASQSKEIIPQSQLYSSGSSTVGIVSLETTQVLVNEADGTAAIAIVRNGDTSTAATVNYGTADGTASAGSDYTALTTQQVVFQPGETRKLITIPILNDTQIESEELFSFSLSSATGASLGAPRTAQIRITDNDSPTNNFTINFPNFNSVSQLQLNGNASQSGSVLQLTPDSGNQKGSAIYKDAIAFDGNTSFQTQFQFRIGGAQGTTGADGLTFVLANTAQQQNFLGADGTNLGYGNTGIGSLAIEFDTYQSFGDFDPNDNHVAIIKDGEVANTVGTIGTPSFDLNSGSPINAWIDYNGATDRLDVFVANTTAKPTTPLVSSTVDLRQLLGSLAYVGFTGATGGLRNSHTIENWQLSSTGAPSVINFNVSEYQVNEAAGTATITVSRGANATSGAASVDYAISNGTAIAGSDYTATSGTLNFAAGVSTASFTIAINNDTEIERNETINLTLSNAIGTTLGNQPTAILRIVDNDTGNFIREDVVTGLNLPTAFDWALNGQRMYVAEKGGIVKMVENGSVIGNFIDLSLEVNNSVDNDRGLLGIAVNPDFINKPFVYLLYTYDPPETAGQTGLAGRDGNGNRPSRLIRVTADASTNYRTVVPGSTKILLGTNSTWANTLRPDVDGTEDLSAVTESGLNPDGSYIQDYLVTDSRSHSIGTVKFGTDGALYVSNGDGASFNRVDLRAKRVQDIDSLSGKILKIDPETGAGIASNPFYDANDPNSNRSKVYSLGLRNPFRFTVNPNTNEPFIGDVGWFTWEEINTGKSLNFGWPWFEGGNGVNLQTPNYSSEALAQQFYASGVTTAPAIFARSHADGARAIVVGDFYTGNTFPTAYKDGLFFSDVIEGSIKVLFFDANGRPDGVKDFASGSQFSYVTYMATGPDGSLYYVKNRGSNNDTGLIGRWKPA